MLMVPDTKEPSNILQNKIKYRKSKVNKVHNLKSDLEQRLKKLEVNMRKLINSSNDKELRDMNGVIQKFQNFNELKNQSEELSCNLAELKTEKFHLEDKLKYLKSIKKPQVKEEEPKNQFELSDQLESAKTRLLNIKEKVEGQEIKIVNIREIFYQIWRNYGIEDKCVLEGKEIKEAFRKLANRVLLVESGGINKGNIKKSGLVRQRTKVWNAVADKKLFGKNIDQPGSGSKYP